MTNSANQCSDIWLFGRAEVLRLQPLVDEKCLRSTWLPKLWDLVAGYQEEQDRTFHLGGLLVECEADEVCFRARNALIKNKIV